MNPKGQLVIQTLAMPANTNANGDIFGGWLISQMDLGAAILAKEISKSRVVTVAMDEIIFRRPVKIGDTLCCYADILRIGNSSIKTHVEAWRLCHLTGEKEQVTEGLITFVAIDHEGKPHTIQKNEEKQNSDSSSNSR
jgi:acyl-CoA thioesterase YciA